MTEYKFIIDSKYHQIRFDKVLSILIPEISRNSISQAIKNGKAKINNYIITDANTSVKRNDIVYLAISPKKDQANGELIPIAMQLDILFEDEHLIVLNKPAGLTVHPNDYNDHQTTLVHGLINHTKNLSNIGGDMRPGIVHRLDKDTSGLMIVAKTNIAHSHLSMQLQSRTLSRKYQAIVWHILSPLGGTINLNIGRNPVDRTKRAVCKSGGKQAITHYKTKQILQKNLLSQVECTLETGRTHQIRVHLSYMGCSIFGDQTYGHHIRKLKKLSLNVQQQVKDFKRQALHSWQLKFIHPINNDVMEFIVPPPADMQQLKTILESCVI